MSVMFCDLVGSTALAERLDPEDYQEIISAYRQLCGEVVQRFDGYIGRYIGDGLLVYFGYPSAHEDDARRAVRAGLAIVEAVREWGQTAAERRVRLAVRIGIDTGIVVVGDVGTGDALEHDAIIGSTPNLAARLQSLAAPNEVVISTATFRLVEGLFVVQWQRPQMLKGVSRPVVTYTVHGESGTHGRFEATVERGLTPLIGRLEEIDLLLKRWRQAKDGETQVVLISGEPGIGKSRLTKGLQVRLKDEQMTCVTFHCSPYRRNSAFYPVIEHLKRAAHFEETDAARTKIDKLAALMGGLGLPAEEVTPLYASLLSLPADSKSGPLARGAEEVRRLILKVLLSMLERIAAQEPVLMVVEDAQWMDPSSLEFVSRIIEQLRQCRLMLIVTFRPGFNPPWYASPDVMTLTLGRLTRKETSAMVSEVTKGRPLPEEIVEQIVEKTDGIPLFTEELTKTVIESDLLLDDGTKYVLSAPMTMLAIPASLHASLIARLDRLSPAKEVAQLAATLGRVFSHDLLAAVAPHGGPELEDALSELVSAGLLYRRGAPPDATYQFKHALVADAAYQSLLRSTRRQYHTRIAHVLETQFPDIAKAHPELVAHHFTEAGLAAKGIAYWSEAGGRASGQSANLEAIAHFNRALDLLATLPQTPERSKAELDLRVSLNGPLIAAKGYSAAELAKNFSRALELCREIGDTNQVFPVMYARWVFHITTGKLIDGFRLANEYLEVAEQQDLDIHRLIGHRVVGPASFIVGKFDLAERHLKQAIALYDPERHRSLTVLYGQDIKAAAQCYLSLTLLHLGRWDQALQCGRDALMQAEAVAHVHSLGNALAHVGAFLHLLTGDHQAAARYAQQLLTYATEHRLPVWQAMGRFYFGWAQAEAGEYAASVEPMREGLSRLRDLNFVYWQPLVLARLAEAHGKLGRVDEGMELIGEALRIIDAGGERWIEAEVRRIEGTLLAGQGADGAKEAERCLSAAIQVARAQNAKWPELRATTSLTRLLQRSGRGRESREQLETVHRWFSEDHDSADLRDAAALLQELA